MDRFITHAFVGPHSEAIAACRPWIAQQSQLEWNTDYKTALALLKKNGLPHLLLLDVAYAADQAYQLYQEVRHQPQGQTTVVIAINPSGSPLEALLATDSALFGLDTRTLENALGDYLKLGLSLSQHNQKLLGLQKISQENKCRITLGAVTEGIAHNMNNLLGVVTGYLDLMKIAANKPEKILKSIGMMEQSLVRMTLIVRQLSLMAQVHPPLQTQITLQNLLETTLDAFYNETGGLRPNVQITYESDSTAPVVTNPALMAEALSKLLMNAWESYAEGTPGPDRFIQLQASIKPLENFGKELNLCVIDHGPGIAPEVKQTLFEPFVTTKVSVGRGMGLPIARHNIKSLGGTLTLQPLKNGPGICAQVTQPFIEGLSQGVMIG